MSACFTTVGLSGNQSIQLLGVMCASAQSGIGESSYLALASRFSKPQELLTCWSCGTGMAGIFGYGWVALFNVFLGQSFAFTLVLANVLVVCWAVVCNFVLLRPDELQWFGCTCSSGYAGVPMNSDLERSDEGVQTVEVPTTFRARFHYIATELWPYTVPLMVVYMSEYAMQSGTWAAIGIPDVHSKDDRADFYLYANWCYQGGVFLSRSSGMLFQAERGCLWVMPVLQAGLLAFFYIDAEQHFWYSWSLMGPCFCTGLLGGAVYINALTLMCREIPKECQEFSLGAVATAFSVGIMLSNVAGLYLQCLLYHSNDIHEKTSVQCGGSGWSNVTTSTLTHHGMASTYLVTHPNAYIPLYT